MDRERAEAAAATQQAKDLSLAQASAVAHHSEAVGQHTQETAAKVDDTNAKLNAYFFEGGKERDIAAGIKAVIPDITATVTAVLKAQQPVPEPRPRLRGGARRPKENSPEAGPSQTRQAAGAPPPDPSESS